MGGERGGRRGRRREDECEVPEAAIAKTMEALESHLRPYQDLLRRREQREHAATYCKGRLRNLPRRTIEPIANSSGINHETRL